MVETKGEHLDNDESEEKAKIGDQWAKNSISIIYCERIVTPVICGGSIWELLNQR